MSKLRIGVGVLAAGLVCGLLTAAAIPSTAATATLAYACTAAVPEGDGVVFGLGCVPSGGAPEAGVVTAAFRISVNGVAAYACGARSDGEPAGIASSGQVFGLSCKPV